MFEIRFDPSTCILHMMSEGQWTLDTLAAFSASVMAQATGIRLRHGQFAVMNDARRLGILSADVAQGLETLLQQSVRISTAPFAMVVGSMLSKLQLQRVLSAGHCRVFLDRAEADAWLDEAWTSRRAA